MPLGASTLSERVAKGELWDWPGLSSRLNSTTHQPRDLGKLLNVSEQEFPQVSNGGNCFYLNECWEDGIY